MKVREIVTNPHIWKTDYLNLDVKIAEKRKEYCKLQTKLGRKDSYNIYLEAKRRYK